MLKITKIIDGRRESLKLEGVLRDAWLEEVRIAASGMHTAKERCLVLADVTYADAEGVALLKELLTQGCKIESCSGFIAATLGLEIP